MTTKTKDTRKLLHLALADVRPDPEQPRKHFDEDEHKALVASVKTWGVLTPITVKANGKGYVIVAGERRFRAAKAAKLPTIPALVDDGENTLAAATVENVMRLDLNPVEEGHAYRGLLDTAGTPAKVAALVTRPVERVEARIALTTLPESVQEQVAKQAITLPVAAMLAVIQAKHGGEPLVLALAWGIENGVYTTTTLGNDPTSCLRSLAQFKPQKECEKCGGIGYLGFEKEDSQEATVVFKSKDDLDAAEEAGAETEWCEVCQGDGQVDDPNGKSDVPDFTCVQVANDSGRTFDPILFLDMTEQEREGWAALNERLEAERDRRAKADPYGSAYEWRRIPEVTGLDPSVAILAESLGSLLTLSNRNGGSARFVLDRELAAEHLFGPYTEVAEAWLAQTEKPKSSRSSSTPAKSKDANLTPEQQAAKEKEQAERKQEREKDAKARKQGRSFNLDLGAAVTTKIAEVTPTVEEARLIVGQLIADHIANERWGGAGCEPVGPAMFLRFTQEQDTNKKGEPVYPRKHDAIKLAVAQVQRELKDAKTVEQVWAVLYRVLAVAAFTDVRGLSGADREGSTGHGLRDYAGWRKALLKRLPPALRTKAPSRSGWSHNG